VNTIVVARRERPISAPVKAGLILLLTLLTLLYFPLCLLALLLIGCVLIADLGLLVILLRLARPGAAIPPMRRLWRLARVIVSTFRSPREGAKYHIDLTEAEAPHLFATVRECARRVGCAAPDSLVLEMNCGAWVRLEGYRSGQGRSTLGLGFYLLTGLGQQEIEAIILHEMAHALLVQRGAKKVGVQGVSRFIRLVEETRDLAQREEPVEGEIWGRFWTADLLARVGALLAAAGVRTYALYSRQDEFDADRSSAALCGGAAFGDALLNSAMLDAKAADFSWHDCVMQSQREGSYTEWMRGKLRIQDEKERAKLRREAIDRDRRSHYSFHPTIEDRIAQVQDEAAGSPVTVRFAPTAPAPWFAEADATVDRLFGLIERAQMDAEREESENLSRWERKRKIRRDANALETIAIVLMLCGGIAIVAGLFALREQGPQSRALVVAGGFAAIGLGVALYRLGAPPEPEMLPVPEFSLFEDSLEKIWAAGGNYAPMLQAPSPAPGGPAASAGRAEKLQYWTERGQNALLRCDYSGALSCGMQALEAVRTNLEGMLLAGVAYNCLGQEAAGDRLLAKVINVHPRSASVRWAMAWACLATANWAPAEAYMLGVVDKAPANATFIAALALAQARHGNLRQAIENMRRAVALEPGSMRLRLRLVQYLLMAGKARAAVPEIEAIEKFPNAQTDCEVQLSLVRLNLMLNHKERADAQAKIASMQHPEAQTFFRLGTSYAMTDHFEDATAYFHHATANALYPMAWVQLGFLHEKEERKTEARVCFLGAVNLFHPIAPKAEEPYDVLSAALAGIRGLRPPSPTLFLWEVALDVRQLPAFKLTDFLLLILAPNRNSAIGYANEIFAAMHPGGPPIETVLRRAEKAEGEPPDSATEPGIVDWRGRR
jgi:Zn-dependent protease with chaperone function/tetratricopeptide (TPR) repeat protein